MIGLRSRRHIAPFALHRPDTTAEAIALRSEPGVSAYMAGGLDLIDAMKHGHTLDRIIRIDRIPGITGITQDGGTIRIGAATTHAALARDAHIPGLAAAWTGVANPRVRYTGTIGGNIMARHRDYDGLPAMLALDAQAEIAGGNCVSVANIPDALVTAFHIRPGATLLTDRSLRPSLTVWLCLRPGELRVAIGMAYATSPVVTLALNGNAADLAAQVADALPEGPAYARRMAGVLTRRLLIRAAAA